MDIKSEDRKVLMPTRRNAYRISPYAPQPKVSTPIVDSDAHRIQQDETPHNNAAETAANDQCQTGTQTPETDVSTNSTNHAEMKAASGKSAEMI